jgi:hypothetical protein
MTESRGRILMQQMDVQIDGAAAQLDPREGIEQLADNIPILMMPVRLETRFTRSRELWVRIYPDDCFVDAFSPTLTASEVEDAQTYWLGMWQSRGLKDQERAAWHALVDAQGAGRAAWITHTYRPVNESARPTEPEHYDLVLTIPTMAPLDANEANELAAYWTAVFAAPRDASHVAAAWADLASALGQQRARELVDGYRPSNIDTELPPGVSRQDVTAVVAYLVLPSDAPTADDAWTTTSRIRLLPQRFVFIGYRAGAEPLVVVGNPVPPDLQAGPDPGAPDDDQLQHDQDGELHLPEQLRWIADFDRAVDVGMGMRIKLSRAQARAGFDRVLVLGVRLNSDPETVRTELQELLEHHARSRTGVAVLPQGVPTNNTEATPAGYSRMDDPDTTFDAQDTPRYTLTGDWTAKRDGQWLAEYLGLAPDFFTHTHGADGLDQRSERDMNTALWPATLGYWMQTMLAPVFGDAAVGSTREFFTRYVLGAGAVPAIRIGRQPYGILPATAFSRMAWFAGTPDAQAMAFGAHAATSGYVAGLYRVLRIIGQDWAALLPQVSRVGTDAPGGDPHQTLLDIVGLHPGSVEWSQRYAETLSMLFNRLKLAGIDLSQAEMETLFDRFFAPKLLKRLGYQGGPPYLLDFVFSGLYRLLTGPVVEEEPLSEIEPLRKSTVNGGNYLRWLIDNGRAGLHALYAQKGFIGDQPPAALLYLLVRHALQLGYHEVSVRLHETSGLYTPEQARSARADDEFLHIRENSAPSESKYQPLVATAPQITGSDSTQVGDFIAVNLGALEASSELAEQFEALERLEGRPTAQLERAFADHLDCCSYRLDAWLLGLVHLQLSLMRGLGTDPPRTGIHVGAYAWLENLRPQRRRLTPHTPSDPDVRGDFLRYRDGTKRPTLTSDSTNQGYVHAPSLNHAVTAAVLRNAHASADPDEREQTAVNLTSQRVRVALAALQGVRSGQSLGALLGYQFERGLHDRHALAEVDQYILDLRKAFPLRADRMSSTKTEPGVAIDQIEARNVIDGLALVEHITATGQSTYPFGKKELPKLSGPQAGAITAAITAEAGRLLDTHDAVADLALAEGVHQAVLGNYDRVASTYDAYAHGAFPPEPEIVRTPFEGLTLTNRVALHLPAGSNPTTSPIDQLAMTPRAHADPSLNAWLAGVLPPLDQVGCLVSFRAADTGLETTREVTLRQLELQPLDLLTIVPDHAEQARSELDDRVVRYLRAHANPRPDGPVTIQYLTAGTVPVSVFEALPALRAARRLITTSRPLTASDLMLTNKARAADLPPPTIDRLRVDLVHTGQPNVHTGLQGVRSELTALRGQLAAVLADPVGHREEILSNVDGYVSQLANVLARAATYGLPQSGWGFAYDAQRQAFGDILRACAELVTRWDGRLAEFNAAIAEYAALPPTSSDEERMRILARAENAILAQPLTPRPPTPAEFAAALQGTPLAQFSAKRGQFASIATTTRTGVTELRADVLALLPTSAFDSTGLSLNPVEDDLILFVEHARSVLDVLLTEVERRLARAVLRLSEYEKQASAADRATSLRAAARALLGDACPLIPQFTVDSTVAAQVTAALGLSRSGALLGHLTHPTDPARQPVDFPVDTWLHGAARVREKLHAWEELQLMASAFGVSEPQLEALQLPADNGVGWLGLDLPPGDPPDSERLLYTAALPTGFDPATPLCGLLLDEWNEVIPAGTAETGLTFHYDRPNSEAPQAMLLVTPSQFRGGWRWHDLVDALNETLQLAKLRALEPDHIGQLTYALFLPATMMTTQIELLTIAVDLGLNNARPAASSGGVT